MTHITDKLLKKMITRNSELSCFLIKILNMSVLIIQDRYGIKKWVVRNVDQISIRLHELHRARK